MTGKEAIKNTISNAQEIMMAYVGDLTDADLMVRPVAGVNHIAWQLGHLAVAENQMLSGAGVTMPALPDGFAEAYTKETSTSDDQAKFHKKQELLAAIQTQREGTIAAMESATDDDLSKLAPEAMQAYAKTVGEIYNMIGIHILMHLGQFVPVRRTQNKPITI